MHRQHALPVSVRSLIVGAAFLLGSAAFAQVSGNMSLELSSHGAVAGASVRAQANTYVTFQNNTSSTQNYTIRTEFTLSQDGEPDWSKAIQTETAVTLQPGEVHQAANNNNTYVQVGSAGTKVVSARTKVVHSSGTDVFGWADLPPEQLIVRTTLDNDDGEIVGAN